MLGTTDGTQGKLAARYLACTPYPAWRFRGLLKGEYQAGDHKWHDPARSSVSQRRRRA